MRPIAAAAVLLAGCATTRPITTAPQHPSVAPPEPEAPAGVLPLDRSVIAPMHQEILAIDLATVVHVAAAQDIDVRQAQLEVQASQGRYDSAVGSAFPVIAPTAGLFEIVGGNARATQGNIVDVAFNSFRTFIAVDWVLNPGRIYYEIVAARKRLAASEHQERAVLAATLHESAIQFYDLVLTQSRVATAWQATAEAGELLRIDELRLRAGTGVPADALRAQARLAQRQQDLALSMNAFYRASVALAVTLRLEPTVTLVPGISEVRPETLVRGDLSIEDLLALAVQYRPDLASVRELVEAAAAASGATWWGGFGPELRAGYLIGGISGHVDEPPQNFDLREQQNFAASATWRLGLSTFANVRTSKAVQEQTVLQAERALDQAKAQVVNALEASRTNGKLIGMARQQVDAATEALRLSQAALESGTMTTLDVLQAQESVAAARQNHAEAVVHYNQSQVDLLTALGLIDERSLGLETASATAGRGTTETAPGP